MDIIISNSSEKPIYDQIAEQIKNAIITGQLKSGEMLPSLRILSRDLRVSVVSTKRAYDELEAEGFIKTVQGKGCFVSGNSASIVKEEYLKTIEEHFRKATEVGDIIDLTLEELDSMFKLIYSEAHNG